MGVWLCRAERPVLRGCLYVVAFVAFGAVTWWDVGYQVERERLAGSRGGAVAELDGDRRAQRAVGAVTLAVAVAGLAASAGRGPGARGSDVA